MTYRLRVLHISDLHERVALGWMKPERQRLIRINTPSRARVLDDRNGNFFRVLRKLTSDHPIDMVCFTGDIADWGLAEEYAAVTSRVRNILAAVGVPDTHFFAVPGNHDIQRNIAEDVWTALRTLPAAQSQNISEWIAGIDSPGLTTEMRTKIASRSAAFWQWLELEFGRKDLHPSNSPHETLGYRHKLMVRDFPFPVHIVGLDSAWLAGDNNDAGRLMLTGHQIDMLAQDGAEFLEGFRLALMHHPLDNLYDKNLAFRRLSRTVDLLLHGHQHEPLSTTLKSPDAQLHVLAAGSIYEGDQGDKWINGFHCIDVELDDSGRPQHYKIQFWAWSPNGHWHEAGGIYESAPSGQLTIPIAPLNRIATSDDPPKATPSHNQLRRSFLGSDPVAGNEALKELIALGDAGEDLLLKGTIPTPATRQVVRRWMKYVRARGESAADVLVRRLLDEEDSGDVRENTILFAGIADSYHVNQKLGSVLGSAFIKSAYSGLYQLKTEPYLHNYQSILEAYGYVGGSVTWLLDFAIGSDFCWDKLRLTLFRAACASFAKSEMNPNSALLDFLRPESEEVLRKHPRRGPDDSWLQFDRHDVMHEAYFGAFDLWQSGAVADLIVSEWSHDPNPMIRAFGAYILERYAFARLDAEIRRWLGREEDVEIQSTLKSALRSAELHEARPVYGATPRPIDAEGVDKTRGDPYAVVILARGGHRVEGLEAMLKASNPFTRGSAALALSYLKDSKYFSNSKRLIREASTPLERVFLATAMANLGVAGISLHDALVEAADVKNDFRQRVEVRWLLPYLQLAILDGLAVSASEDQFDAWKQEMESFN